MAKIKLPDIATIQSDFKQFNFEEAQEFYWSPATKCLYFNPKLIKKPEGVYQLLHELGHALLNHTDYKSGIELLKLESAAWLKAKELADMYGLTINKKQIESCLDSYRDWLYTRSVCPTCGTIATETEQNIYHCFNCSENWKVPKDQRTRHYRLKLAV